MAAILWANNSVFTSAPARSEPALIFSKKSIRGLEGLPHQFRTMRDKVKTERESAQEKMKIKYEHEEIEPQKLAKKILKMEQNTKAGPYQAEEYAQLTKGLDKLNASASAQFTVENFKPMISRLQEMKAKNITIVDLRRESHCFINGLPYFWFLSSEFDHLNKSVEEIEIDEQKRVTSLKSSNKAIVLKTKEINNTKMPDPTSETEIETNEVTYEKDLVETAGLNYLRIAITDQSAPSIQAIDQFLMYYKTHKDSWLHFHCNAGKGRTTTFLALYDMMHNAKDVDLQTIIKRQKLIGQGGANLLSADGTNGDLKSSEYIQRLEIIKEFYQYSKENEDDFDTLFSVWLEEHKKEEPSQMPIAENYSIDGTMVE